VEREALRERARTSAVPHLWPAKFAALREALLEAAQG